jgi:CheY-like chemotaxis protein
MSEWKILLVDDDPEDRAIIKDALDQMEAGDLVEFAGDGEQALSILDTGAHKGHKPTLIVLDLNMPRMNGTQTLLQLKNDDRFKEIPVVIYSTSINPLEKEKCMGLGAHSYVTKPISFQESLDTARLFLRVSNNLHRA